MNILEDWTVGKNELLIGQNTERNQHIRGKTPSRASDSGGGRRTRGRAEKIHQQMRGSGAKPRHAS